MSANREHFDPRRSACAMLLHDDVLASAHASPSDRPRGPGPPPRRAARALAVLLALAALAAGAVYGAGADARALRALPQDARLALFHRTVQNLGSVCTPGGSGALSAFCDEQARLALAFPECDEACTRTAREALRQPTR